MTDVFLIQPPIRDFYLTAKRTVPYGLTCIAAALLRAGFAVELFDALATGKSRIIDLPQEMDYISTYYHRPDRSPFGLFYHYRHFGYSFEHIGKVARDSGAFLVGISALFTSYFKEVLHTAEAVKHYHPSCKIVVGGHHPTAMPSSVMANPVIDFVIRGEGEAALPLLAEAIKNGTELTAVPGIVFRKSDGNVHVDDATWTASPDLLPVPAGHLIKNCFYRRGSKHGAVIVTSRGCPLKCSYCSVGSSPHLPYRRRSIASVLQEIAATVADHEAVFIDFEDENLALDKQWFLNLLHQIKTRFSGIRMELRAMNGLLPSSLDDETVQAMQSAGFRTLNLSLGSTSRTQLERFNRPDVRSSFIRALDLAEAHGLTAVGYVIVGAPYQNAYESLEDLIFLAARRVLAGISVFYPAPGSRDYDLCRSLGILPAAFSLMRSSMMPLSHTTTRLEVVTLVRLGRILNFMKHLRDLDPETGDAAKYHAGDRKPNGRVEAGRGLLNMFLDDGKIRGIAPAGDIFEHNISLQLSRRFVRALEDIHVRGTR